MTELLIIKTTDANKLKNVLVRNQIDYQVIYNEIIQDRELTDQKFEEQLAKDYQDWANDPEEWKDAAGE